MCHLLSKQCNVQVQSWKRLDITDKQNVPGQKAFADFRLLFAALNLRHTPVPGEKAAEGSPFKSQPLNCITKTGAVHFPARVYAP